MKHSASGTPILPMQRKLEVLAYCIKHGHHEDACAHLCDLLAHEGAKIRPSVGEPFKGLGELVAYYGKDPTPIEE